MTIPRLRVRWDLSVFGLVQPGESVLITEGAVADFRTAWGLSNSVKIIGGNTNNLGRSDEMNLYDSASHLVDSLTFNDEGSGTVKGPRARYFSANVPNRAALGTNKLLQVGPCPAWGDSFGSWKSAKVGSSYDVASPGPIHRAGAGHGGVSGSGRIEHVRGSAERPP